MTEASKLKETLLRDLEKLGKARDELKVHLLAAKSDAKKEWTRLEGTWKSEQTEIKRVTKDTKKPVKGLDVAAKALMKELKTGYTRIKKEVVKTTKA